MRLTLRAWAILDVAKRPAAVRQTAHGKLAERATRWETKPSRTPVVEDSRTWVHRCLVPEEGITAEDCRTIRR
jgi:hypothetical protein